MIKEYIQYLQDNPQGHWFKTKLYGWGWVPVKWQGWCTLLVYIAFILTMVISREKDIPGNPDSGSNFLVFALPIILSTALLIFICYKKGEKPRWQWGPPKNR
jgi:uncharacterized membrane protein YhaH (DUF805 family)